MDGLNDCDEWEDERYGVYGDWSEDTFRELTIEEFEDLPQKAKNRISDLRSSNCYMRNSNKEIMIMVSEFGDMQNWSMRYAKGLFINTKTKTISMTDSYPFITDVMIKITQHKFGTILRKHFLSLLGEMQKLVKE